jgi:GNAT superfamily N-acetyltransferase
VSAAGQGASPAIAIRGAEPGDAGLILDLVRGLAVYERLLDQVEATEERIAASLFSDNPRVFCDIAEAGGRPVGFALWFYNYSTFLGRHGLYLEDLFVVPEARRLGVGRALFRHLARRCVAEGLGRFEWAVLDWNTPAIDFYKGQGATLLDDWTACRLTGDSLRALAEEET